MNPLVTPAMMARIRGYGNRQLVTTMVIQRRIQTETEYGSNTSYQPVQTVKGWLRMFNKPDLVEKTGVIGATGIFRLHLPQGTDIREGDQVLVTDPNLTVGEPYPLKYIVNDVNNDDTIQVFTTALVRRIE